MKMRPTDDGEATAKRDARADDMHSGRGTRGIVRTLIATILLLGLIALLLALAEGYLAAVVLFAIVAVVGSLHLLLGISRTFAFTLANLIGIYACVFLFFAESNFAAVTVTALSVGFLMPLLAFVAGSLRHRHDLNRVLQSARIQEERRLGAILFWLVPVFAVGVLTFLLPQGDAAAGVQRVALFAAMLVISAIVFAVSHDVAVFLLDTGVLFDRFFARISRLVVPAFAFLTCYSLLVIMFASAYAIIDHVTAQANFRIDGVARHLSFAEALFFSLTTLSTVGYGDIAPASNAVRLLTAVEIVCGILLLLFGFNEIFSFAQEQARRRSAKPHDATED